MIICLILSFVFIYDKYFPMDSLKNLKLGDKLSVWILTLVLFAVYVFSKDKPQLMPVLANEKENNENRDKSTVSFKDVAGLEEIKEELQETIDFINNSYKYRKMGGRKFLKAYCSMAHLVLVRPYWQRLLQGKPILLSFMPVVLSL